MDSEKLSEGVTSVTFFQESFLLRQINQIVQCWVSEHFPDFEGQDEMEEFLDWFEQRLVEDVSLRLTHAPVNPCTPVGSELAFLKEAVV